MRAVVGGVVASGHFQDIFGRAVDGLHDRLLNEETAAAERVIQLHEGMDRR